MTESTTTPPGYALHRELTAAKEELERADKSLGNKVDELAGEVKTLGPEVKGLKTGLTDLAAQVRVGVRALCVIAMVLIAWFTKANPGMAAPIFDGLVKLTKLVAP